MFPPPKESKSRKRTDSLQTSKEKRRKGNNASRNFSRPYYILCFQEVPSSIWGIPQSINQSINQSLRNEEPINVDTAEVAHVPELEPLVREQVGGNDDELSVNVLI
jgi:hypothetical protein